MRRDPSGSASSLRPVPRSSGPLAVLQVVEFAEREPDNPAVGRAGCERNAAGNGCNGLAGLDTRDDVLSNLNLLGSSKTEESAQVNLRFPYYADDKE